MDAEAPGSQVDPLPASVNDTSVLVSWLGQDEENGSGLADYDIYVSDNGNPFTLWLGDTTDTSALFTGEENHTYAFYSIATDNVGHAEAPPGTPDAGANWENLGTFNITGNTLMVTLNDAADEYVMADGIRIERVGPPLLMAPALDLSWVETAFSNSDDDDDDKKEEQAIDLILQMDDLLS